MFNTNLAITNCFRKNEETGPNRKQCSAVDVSGGETKVLWCKEQYCLEAWNIISINQQIGSDLAGDGKSEH